MGKKNLSPETEKKIGRKWQRKIKVQKHSKKIGRKWVKKSKSRNIVKK